MIIAFLTNVWYFGQKIGAQESINNFFSINLDTLVNIYTIFYGKRMRITKKILVFKNAQNFIGLEKIGVKKILI